MRIESAVESTIYRRARLVEKVYHRPVCRIRELASELGVDRNTLLADMQALASFYADDVEKYAHGDGAVELRFAPDVALIALVQRMYAQSLVLQLLVAYIDGPVDMRSFADENGVSLSHAYSIDKRATESLADLGIGVARHALVCDEWRFRFLSMVLRTMTGARTPTMAAYEHDLEAAVVQVERRTGRRYHGISRPLLRCALAMSLDRSSRAIDGSLLDLLSDVPLLDYLRTELLVAGRRLDEQEARFFAFSLLCVDTDPGSGEEGDDRGTWIERLPGFTDLVDAMAARFGGGVASSGLFLSALRACFIYLRFDICGFALVQHRPDSPEIQPLLDASLDVIGTWAARTSGAGMPTTDLVKLFAYQIRPLFGSDDMLAPFGYVVVTSNETNRLHFIEVLSRSFGLQAIRIDGPGTTMADARATCAEWSASSGFPSVVVFDVEYPENAGRSSFLTPLGNRRAAARQQAPANLARLSVLSSTSQVRDAVLACLA